MVQVDSNDTGDRALDQAAVHSQLSQHERWLRTVVSSQLDEPQAVDEVMQEVALAAMGSAAPADTSRWLELKEPMRKQWNTGGKGMRWAAIVSVAAGLVLAFWLGRSWPFENLREGRDGAPKGQGDSVTLLFPAGEQGAVEEIRVPLVEVSRSDPSWQWMQEAMLKNALFSQLIEEGHQVFERRDLISIQLEDGRQAVIPIDEIEVLPASYPTYH